jgi:hypothetical protein
MNTMFSGLGRSFGPFEHTQGLRHHFHHHDVASTKDTSASAATATTSTGTPSSDNTHSVNTLDALSSILSGLSSAVANLNDLLTGLTGGSDAQSSVAAQSSSDLSAQLITKERGVLQIQTQEGDIVPLKFHARTAVDYQFASASDGTNSTTGTTLNVRGHAGVRLSVKGNLNDNELAAINDLVGKVGALTDEFYSGNVDQALNDALNLSYDNSQLTNVSLSLSLKQSLVVQGYSYLANPQNIAANEAANDATADSATTDATAPESSTQSSTPVTATTSDTTQANALASASSAPAAAETTASPSVIAAAAANADRTDASQTSADATDATAASTSRTTPGNAEPAAATQTLAAFMLKVRESLKVTATDASLGFSYEFKVRLLVASIQLNAPTRSTTSDSALGTLNNQLTAPAAA